MDILEEIVAHKRAEMEEWKHFLPERKLYGLVEQQMQADDGQVPGGSMAAALLASGTGIIAEFKRKSPSKGWIRQEAKPERVASDYQNNGAAAISILTDNHYFGGYDEHVRQARMSGVTIPILYKNFIVDEYQLFQARYCGASAVLLIAAVLTKDECRSLSSLAHELGMEILLEMHSERDLEYAELEPDMYGINNRHLGTFTTDVDVSFRLVTQFPVDACKVSESGIGSAETVARLRKASFNGFLMGEHLMKSENPGVELKHLITSLKNL